MGDFLNQLKDKISSVKQNLSSLLSPVFNSNQIQDSIISQSTPVGFVPKQRTAQSMNFPLTAEYEKKKGFGGESIAHSDNPMLQGMAMQAGITEGQLKEAAPKGRIATAAAMVDLALPSHGVGQAASGVRMATRLPGAGIAEEAVNVGKKVFEGFKDFSTKLLEDLKGKTEVPKSYIEQRLVSSDLNLKQVEKDLVRMHLNNMEGDKINVSDLANKVKDDLLPLKVRFGTPEYLTTRYERVNLPGELRGEVRNYREKIYESPIKTSAGDVHFPGDTKNYFGHTRIEDLADNKTRRVIEVQSDLYQKGRLKNNAPKERLIAENEAIIENAKNNIKYGKKIGSEIMVNEESSRLKNAEEQLKFYKEGGINPARRNYNKLFDYNDPTAHFRMVREEVKKAAEDGKSLLQFPTGETAMKVEGLGDLNNFEFSGIEYEDISQKIKPEDLKKGLEIRQGVMGGQEWVVTDILEDGKFKAVPKNKYDFELNDFIQSYEETFDISGKVDKNNPIYKFYEKDLGKYLKSKYNAQLITDDRGVSWWQIKIDPKWKDLPVEAFGLGLVPLFYKDKNENKQK